MELYSLDMPFVISKKLRNDILGDLKMILNNTNDAKAIETIKDRIDRLEKSPQFQPGQAYTD